MQSLKGQVVLVTGCSTGIGRALVRELQATGHRPFATARKPEAIADLAAAGIETLRLDVRDAASIVSAVDDVIERAGRIDVLINNAGIGAHGPIAEMPLDKLRLVFETNVLGLVAVTQCVFPGMADRRRGLIVNMGSVAGLLPIPYVAGYCASKSAVHIVSECLRMEARPFGIDVVVVQPGGVRSSIADSGPQEIERFGAPGSRYRSYHDGIRKCVDAAQDDATPADEFASDVIERAFATPPPRTIRTGTGAAFLTKLAGMPEEQRDAVFVSSYGLDSTAP
jgi:NAD(P)-dependent dehydrogenase (short-subunit alcohol dehydrogenase family)